jgi:hypothetical protein
MSDRKQNCVVAFQILVTTCYNLFYILQSFHQNVTLHLVYPSTISSLNIFSVDHTHMTIVGIYAHTSTILIEYFELLKMLSISHITIGHIKPLCFTACQNYNIKYLYHTTLPIEGLCVHKRNSAVVRLHGSSGLKVLALYR